MARGLRCRVHTASLQLVRLLHTARAGRSALHIGTAECCALHSGRNRTEQVNTTNDIEAATRAELCVHELVLRDVTLRRGLLVPSMHALRCMLA